ncbi:hypothetical protein GOP47_0020721 [Adiantum capillus-veneris]|uniref:Uncharacterized protein n=1 Tax=Adiantum capillus-veneris TaxID=13818 RepID=A0A9D4UBK8_ADICA|nr:hypothetical protein GOP47_0020721 [Adiantum capillus-veneris]
MIEDPSNLSPYADISWEKIDKVKFHTYGAGLFTLLSTALYPISVVKTRVQVGRRNAVHTSSLRIFKSILKDDGVKGLYRGFTTTATGAIPGRAMFLATLEISKESTSKLLSDVNLPDATKTAVANGVAGLVSSLISELYYVPLDVVTQRLMVQGLPGVAKYNGGIHAFRKILHTDGVCGLYRGFGMSVATYCPSTTVWWGAYGASQHAIWKSLGFADGQHPGEVLVVSVQAAGGVVAGAASSVITTPLDTIKTRLQVMENKEGHKPTIIGTAKQLINEDGWRGFYRGLGPRFLNMSLWGTSMIVTYEYLKRLSVKPMPQ